MKQKRNAPRPARRARPGRCLALLLSLCACLAAEAKVKLPAILADGMVLQREQPLRLWGTADAGEAITVRFEGASLPRSTRNRELKEACTATADSSGRWSLTLPPLKPGGPYTLQVNDLRLTDILVGDVWLCSGQSNMELPVRRVTDMFADEIAAYENDKIRHIIVPKVYDFHAPQADFPRTSWKALTRDNAPEFSALAYFFAKALHEKSGVPVGIVNASWGGTPVEAWISEEGLKPFPLYLNAKSLYEDDGYLRRIKQLEAENFTRWNAALYRGDSGLHEATPWYAPQYDDTQWQTVGMFAQDITLKELHPDDTNWKEKSQKPQNWGTNGLNPVGGSHWLRKHLQLPASCAGKEGTLRLGCIVDADSVYVNGVFVGTTGYQYPPRIYKIPAGVLRSGDNCVTVRIISNGGRPHFVPEKPYKIICGTEEFSLEGDWKYRPGAPMPDAPDMMFFCYQPVCLYNAMIAPLSRFAMRGAVWYQGESNVSRRNEYASLLAALMADWRRTFGNEELPFFIVELADFLHPSDTAGRQAWAEMRQAQAQAAVADPHATLVRNSDLGEWNDIHPLDKKTLGQRVADAVEQAGCAGAPGRKAAGTEKR